MLIQWYPPFKTPTQAPSNNVLQKGVVFGQGFIKSFTRQKEGKGLRKTGLKWPMLFSCAAKQLSRQGSHISFFTLELLNCCLRVVFLHMKTT